MLFTQQCQDFILTLLKKLFKKNLIILIDVFYEEFRIINKNGGRGIRTPVTIAREAIFKTAAFSLSAIPPHFLFAGIVILTFSTPE